MKLDVSVKTIAGITTAVNIQRHPYCTFQDWRKSAEDM